jgi:adenosylhomocysteinase
MPFGFQSKRHFSSSLGRKEIELAEAEMPGLMALRSEYKERATTCWFSYCRMFTIQTAVLIETLIALGAEVTWSSCNISLLKIKLLLQLWPQRFKFTLGKVK